MKYYLSESKNVLNNLKTNENGLTQEEANSRTLLYGKNKLQEQKKDSMLKKFIKSLADPMIIMLIIAALIQAIVTVVETHGSFSLYDFADVLVILVVVIINTIMSLVQESKSEAAMAALMQMTAATSKVLRDGKIEIIKSEDIVVGDIIIIEAGDSVPADCRIIESHSIKAEEAALTGESVPVSKIIDVLMCKDNNSDISLGDRKNMLYSGSTIVYGRGKAVVTAIGMDTEMGKIAAALDQASQEQTPLQKKMSELSKFLTKLVIAICLVVFFIGIIESIILNGQSFSWSILGKTSLDTFIAAIALAVAAIPEGLPAVVTIILSMGVTAMSKRQALIRKLTAVETLGCTQIICSDKTGTLTQNKMTVVDTFTENSILLATAMALCNDAKRDVSLHTAIGEPTECALINHAHDLSLYKDVLDVENVRIGEAPFDSERKMMSTIHNTPQGITQYTKGACEIILDHCTSYLLNGKIVPITNEYKNYVLSQVKEYANRALRVLGAAYKIYDNAPNNFDSNNLEKNLIFIGFVGMIDPCRPEVYSAIDECRLAGIRPIMITGDHKDTAVAIGKDLGIIKSSSEAIEGFELDKFTDEELIEEVIKYSVYARVQPEHKTRIVKAWKARGYVTAMTGDGVNDAPSIKESDIGIGMGITGTDVTKGVADMILADDNFATIVNAVEEGRKIYDNVCKVLQFQLSTNMSEVIIMFLASLFNFTILTPVHLLWINMVTDSLPGLALGKEKAEGNLMKRKPRSTSDSLFSDGSGFDMIWQGIYISIIVFLSYFIGYHLENGSLFGIFSGTKCTNAMAMAFLTVNFSELACAINMRSRRGSIFSKSMLKSRNTWLIAASIITVFLTLIAIYLPGLQEVFDIMPGTFDRKELIISILLAVSTFPIFELGKAIRRIKKTVC